MLKKKTGYSNLYFLHILQEEKQTKPINSQRKKAKAISKKKEQLVT